MVLRCQGLAALRWLLVTIATVAPSSAQMKTQATPWVRNLPNNHGVIIFVHGVLGDERSTWSSGDQYWPSTLTHDPTFDGQNIYVYRYPSPRLSRAFSIDEIADNMRLVLSTDGVLRHSELTFVSHSMGGLVTRAFILKYRNVVPKLRMLYFFATPTTGSPYALLASIVSRNTPLRQLYPMQSDNYLGTLQSNWLAANFGLKSYCGYETQPYYGQIIVERQSATDLCTQALDPIDADHITIVKPKDQNSTSYRALKGAFQESSRLTITTGGATKAEDRRKPKAAATAKDSASIPPAQVQVKNAPGAMVNSGISAPSTDIAVPSKASNLRENGLALSKDILSFLEERQRANPGVQGPPFFGVGQSQSRSNNDKTPQYMKLSRDLFTERFEARIADLHDEFSRIGLQESELEGAYKHLPTIFGNVDTAIQHIAASIRTLALLCPPDGLYNGISDARLADLAIEEADRVDAMTGKAIAYSGEGERGSGRKPNGIPVGR